MMNSIAPYIASPITIGLVVFGLITWAVASGYRLHVATRKLLAEIVRARGQVEETDGASTFKGKYEAVAESLGDNPVLGPRWREYQHSLWISDSGMIRATTRSDDWFNLDLLRSPVIGIDPGYHAALPGLLVGAGLLFTFIGLAVALGSAGGIVADNVTQAQRNSALHDLLGAASLKFWTSVAGLLMSICYALYRKYRLHRVELALEAFQAALDTRIPIITQVQMQAESNSHLASQTTAMQSFSNDLAINLAGVFDNAFDRRLGEHIAPLTTAMQQLAESLTARNEDTMEKMLGVFLDKLKGDTGNQMAGVADKLAALANGLEGLQTGMQEAARRMAEAADAMARRMGEGAEEAMAEVTRQMSSLVETLRKLAENSRSMGTTALAAVAGRIDSAASSFEGVSERIAKALENAATQTGGAFDQGATNAVERIVAATEGMRSELQTMLASLRESIGEAGSAMSEGGKAGAEVMRNTLRQASTDLAGDLGKAASALRQAGETASSALREGGEAASQSMEGAGTSIAGRADALGRQVGGLTDASGQLVSRIADLNNATSESARPLAVATEQLRKVAESMHAATVPLSEVAQRAASLVNQVAVTAQRLEAAQSGTTKLADSMEKASQRFEGVDKNLALVLTQLQAGTARFAKDVTDFVSSIDSNLAKATSQVGNLVKSLDDTIQDFNDARPRAR